MLAVKMARKQQSQGSVSKWRILDSPKILISMNIMFQNHTIFPDFTTAPDFETKLNWQSSDATVKTQDAPGPRKTPGGR